MPLFAMLLLIMLLAAIFFSTCQLLMPLDGAEPALSDTRYAAVTPYMLITLPLR